MSESITRSPRRILHVEDSELDAELIQHRLHESWPDCAVDRVDCRFDFLAAIERHKFDLVLSDFSMPGFNGLEALELIRAHQPATPFIFLSGTIGERNAQQALRSGAADYLEKDRPERLIDAIQAALNRGHAASPPQRAETANKRTVLLIDDEDGVREIVAALLESKGFGVVSAANGNEGLALYQSRHAEFDAVLSDMMMPGLRIDALVPALRAVNPDVRIVTMSGMSPERWGLRFEPGRLQFLAKPMAADELLRALEQVMPAARHP